MASPFALIAAGRTDSGPVRRTNEDSTLVDVYLRLFAVADGMGGHNSGEIASRLAVESIVGFVSRSHDHSDFSWPYGIDSALSYQANRLRTAINLANRRVFRAAESHDDYTGMGSTVVSMLCGPDSVILGHVGDSRAYRFRPGTPCEQLTVDDTWVVAMMAQSDADADADAMRDHPMKHVLTNVLGSKEQTEIHVAEHSAQAGDRFLLCSDGLHGVLSSEDLERLVSAAGDTPDDTAGRLVAEALARGSRDNVTALVIHIGAAG